MSTNPTDTDITRPSSTDLLDPERDLVSRIDALAEKAIARPWQDTTHLSILSFPKVDEYEEVIKHYSTSGSPDEQEWERRLAEASADVAQVERQSDLDFIVALVNAWPALRARLRAAEAALDVAWGWRHKMAKPADFDRHYEAWRRARGEGGT